MYVQGRRLLLLLVLALAFSGVAHAQDGKRHVSITIGQYPTDVEMLAWTAYGVSLGDWVNKNRVADTAPEGPFVPTFEAELYARQAQLTIWRELNESKPQPLSYMNEMQRVQAAGFLREYIWHYHRQRTWQAQPTELRMDAFLEWQASHLRGHTPQTGAHISFGPQTERR
jgi:hypothetical protein